MNSEIDYASEYDNSSRVENAYQLINKYISDAATYREFAAERSQLDLAYGNGERNKMDIFWPDSAAGRERKSPMAMFIHGGYWHLMDRSCFSHLSAGLNANGIAVAMPSYTLCPQIKVGGIINEMRRASLILYQTFQRRITVLGHSAGGHLAACVMATEWQKIHSELPLDLIASGMGISGLYNLMPILKTPINNVLDMDEKQAKSASPIHWVPEAMQQFDAWVGSEESGEYHRQSRELADHWSLLGTPTYYVSVPDANHFTIVDQLVQPDSPMVKRLVKLVEQPKSDFKLPEVNEAEVDKLMHQFVEASKAPQSGDGDGGGADDDDDDSDDGEGANSDDGDEDGGGGGDGNLGKEQDRGETIHSKNNGQSPAESDAEKPHRLTIPEEIEESAEEQPKQTAKTDQADATSKKKAK